MIEHPRPERSVTRKEIRAARRASGGAPWNARHAEPLARRERRVGPYEQLGGRSPARPERAAAPRSARVSFETRRARAPTRYGECVRPRQTFLLVLILIGSSVCSCGVLVGDISGDYRVPSADAGGRHLDAGSVDASAVADAVFFDARRDISVDAGDDVARLESGAIDGGHDAGVRDAAHESASSHDAGGFCARYRPPLGAAFVCDDFDEDAGWSSLGLNMKFVQPVAEIGVNEDASVSPPSSMLLVAGSASAAGSESSEMVVRALPPAQAYTLDFDVNVAHLGASAYLGGFRSSGNDSLALRLDPSSSGVVVDVAVGEQDTVDGGGQVFPNHSMANVTATTWMHVHYEISSSAAGPIDTVVVGGTYGDAGVVGGTAVEVNAHLHAGFFSGAMTACVGWWYVPTSGTATGQFDNVVITVE